MASPEEPAEDLAFQVQKLWSQPAIQDQSSPFLPTSNSSSLPRRKPRQFLTFARGDASHAVYSTAALVQKTERTRLPASAAKALLASTIFCAFSLLSWPSFKIWGTVYTNLMFQPAGHPGCSAQHRAAPRAKDPQEHLNFIGPNPLTVTTGHNGISTGACIIIEASGCEWVRPQPNINPVSPRSRAKRNNSKSWIKAYFGICSTAPRMKGDIVWAHYRGCSKN